VYVCVYTNIWFLVLFHLYYFIVMLRLIIKTMCVCTDLAIRSTCMIGIIIIKKYIFALFYICNICRHIFVYTLCAIFYDNNNNNSDNNNNV